MVSLIRSPKNYILAAMFVCLVVVTANAGTEKVLHEFNVQDGEYPYNGVVLDSAGNLYGTAFYGGSKTTQFGVVFKLTPEAGGGWTESTIYKFTGGADGNHPYSHLVMDAAGNLYGTTYGANDGGSGKGTAYQLSPQADGSYKFTLLHTFGGGQDGAQPNGYMGMDSAGSLYGTTFTGGSFNLGTAFELTPLSGGAWKETLLHTFSGGLDGANPSDGVILANGNLYGTTELGGNGCSESGCGVVFELAQTENGGWKETFLHRFAHGPDGYSPVGLIFDSVGNLYGAAAGGEAQCGGCGSVFRLTPNANGTWTDTPLHEFNGQNGSGPETLAFDAQGHVYGVTNQGGIGAGVIFSLDPNQDWTETVLYVFLDGVDGGEPVRPLTLDAEGNIYGTTLSGGTLGVGTVFEFTP